eukprot:m.190103 g.190103  ORF g.190103 m.190103 type:complete len:51 (+) comp16751_c0_seq3:4381-4533(+)
MDDDLEEKIAELAEKYVSVNRNDFFCIQLLRCQLVVSFHPMPYKCTKLFC